ncbi:hypothetical protein E6W39_29995 [Kitasatospora acidiphila]|uniref:Uncharacterized protein n=1 Tax=Kitasatospora acidiphila TaxID=2567942 RepID=A0A540WBA6_9ACTN|nr:hypothetical protein [Kitasatospora acidiphila]TQF05684.1 hypothetical protein E6W39_29995 [Kitasatospora acidiphila]
MVTASQHPSDEPLIPMPPLTFPGLQKAVATLVPSRLPELFEDMRQTFIWAEEQESISPIRLFHLRWGMVIAIERIPSRAHRFRECEHRVANAGTREEARAASIEIGRILAEAEAEVRG